MAYPIPAAFAFNLADNSAEWPEIALAVGAAFVGAYLISRAIGRLVRWSMHGVLASDHVPALPTPGAEPLLAIRVLIFLLVWVALSVPLLDAVGLPLQLGTGRQDVRRWLFGSGLRILLVVLVAWMVLRIARSATLRIERELAAAADGLDVIERTKRAQTLGQLSQNVLNVVVTSIALLMVLRELGVDIVPMLTGAGIVGVALGFGAQYLVRDVIAGFFLILENQVRVGDVAEINGTGGSVEAVNLRTIVLRDFEGTLHIFQNGAIDTLANRSKDFAYYVVELTVPYGQNTDQVIDVMRDAGRELAADPGFASNILAPIEVVGIDAFQDAGVTIKARIKTRPLKQWEVGRELRRRLMMALERQHIGLRPTAVPLYVAGVARETENAKRKT